MILRLLYRICDDALHANAWVQQFQDAHVRSTNAPDARIILSDIRLSEQQAQHSRTRNIPLDTEIAMMLEYHTTNNVRQTNQHKL